MMMRAKTGAKINNVPKCFIFRPKHRCCECLCRLTDPKIAMMNILILVN